MTEAQLGIVHGSDLAGSQLQSLQCRLLCNALQADVAQINNTVVIELVHDLLDFTELVIEEVLTCNGQLLDLGSDLIQLAKDWSWVSGVRLIAKQFLRLAAILDRVPSWLQVTNRWYRFWQTTSAASTLPRDSGELPERPKFTSRVGLVRDRKFSGEGTISVEA